MAARGLRDRIFMAIGLLLLLEALYFLYAAWADVALYRWGAGESASLRGFLRDGAAASALQDLVWAGLGATLALGALRSNPMARQIVSWSSPLVFGWGVWVTSNTAPAVLAWAGAFEGDYVALSAIAGLVASAAGALGVVTLVWR